MSLSLLQRAIACLEAGSLPPAPVKEYILGILDRRHHKPRKTVSKFDAQLMPIPKLKKELDRVFSLFIRVRDSDEQGMGRCCTCGHWAHWKTMDCGHYQVRQDYNTRWDEKNCALQCGPCNGFRGGCQEVMAGYIDKRYGAGTAERLWLKARLPLKLDRHKLQLWINHYKAQIAEAQ